MKYRFNDRIFFDVDTGALSLCDFSDDSIPISNPSKRLLQLLIAHHGEAVSREVIFKKVWDDYGMVSSNNNLNQCVSKLRKVIKVLGIDDDVIVTVPKVGFMLRREIRVEACETDDDAAINDDELPLAKSPAYVETNPLSATVRFLPPRYAHYGWGMLVFVLVVISGIAIYAFTPLSRQEIYLGKVEGCKIFMSVSTEAGFGDDVLVYVERQKVQCNADEYLLLVRSNQVKSYISGISRLFFLRCKVFREYKTEICSGLENENSPLMR